MDFSHFCVAWCFFVLLWQGHEGGCQQSFQSEADETYPQHSVGVDQEVAAWASSNGITPDTIRVLAQEGFTSLMLLQHLSSHDVTESLQKPGLLSLAQSLALKKALQKLCDEGSKTCGRNEELPPDEPQVEANKASQHSGTETFTKMSDANKERTFIAVKPDGVQRGLIGEIVKRFEQRGYKLVAAKMCMPGKAHLEKHYIDLASKPFYKDLVQYMISGPIFAMVWEGKEAAKMGRMLLGATNPRDSLPGTIRGDFCIDVGRNVCHGSDSVESANKEINLWFKPEELMSYEDHSNPWVYE